MRLKYRLGAIASVLALAASLGLAVAAPSGAAVGRASRVVPRINDKHLCANTPDGTRCANTVSPVTLSSGSGGSWDFPTSSGQITVYNSNPSKSMTVNTSTDVVTLSSTAGHADQEWDVTSDGGGYYTFKNPDTGLCLNAKYPNNTVNVASCNGGEDEQWN